MQIKATIIQASQCAVTGTRITTYELEYPRYIHAEFMTHRVFSRNAASSRAIPVATMHKQIREHNVGFVHWGLNQPGMQSKQELTGFKLRLAKLTWALSRELAIGCSKILAWLGLHKQVVNRATEPYMMMKVILTTTDIANWVWLRNHSDAQPEIQALAKVMIEASEQEPYMVINSGEWHVPYVSRVRDSRTGKLKYMTFGDEITVEQAHMLSASCCAQVSYRKSDVSLSKAMQIYYRLIESEPVHASPIEHQATPIGVFDVTKRPYAEGITHFTVAGVPCSGNFRNWIQLRQLKSNNAKHDV